MCAPSAAWTVLALAPATGDRFTARGRVVRVGRTLGVATAEVIAHAAGKPDTPVALMQATLMRLEPRAGAAG